MEEMSDDDESVCSETENSENPINSTPSAQKYNAEFKKVYLNLKILKNM
jgi:hypothetical protein